MVYKQGVNKVVNDEVFPYPLKCWYDDENIYVQVLRIPEPEECKLSPYIMKGIENGLYNINNYDFSDSRNKHKYYGYRNNYFRKLVLCLETKSNKALTRSNGLEGESQITHKVKGRFKYVINTPTYEVQENRIFTFPISTRYLNNVANSQREKGNNYFITIRATIRFLRYGGTSSQIEPNPILERTGIYSNTIIIHK